MNCHFFAEMMGERVCLNFSNIFKLLQKDQAFGLLYEVNSTQPGKNTLLRYKPFHKGLCSGFCLCRSISIQPQKAARNILERIFLN